MQNFPQVCILYVGEADVWLLEVQLVLVLFGVFCLCFLVWKRVNSVPNLLYRCIYVAPKPDGVHLNGFCEGGVLGCYY